MLRERLRAPSRLSKNCFLPSPPVDMECTAHARGHPPALLVFHPSPPVDMECTRRSSMTSPGSPRAFHPSPPVDIECTRFFSTVNEHSPTSSRPHPAWTLGAAVDPLSILTSRTVSFQTSPRLDIGCSGHAPRGGCRSRLVPDLTP